MAKAKKKTAKKPAKKVVKKKAAKKKIAERGGFSLNWGDKFEWFKAEAKRLGMNGANLIKAAVEEFVEKRPPENEDEQK